MKHIKIICAIAAAALLTGCADEAVSSATTQTTAQTTTTAETTVQTTTAATTTTATAAETTFTEATTTTADEVVVEPEETRPNINEAKPPQESEKTPDGKYDLADTDLVNTDGTYTQNCDSIDSMTVPEFLTDKDPKIFVKPGEQSNPSRIPYSEITLENAHEAFPYLGFVSYTPDYIEILPTDTPAQIRIKVMQNLAGTEVSSWGGHSMDTYPSHYFKTEAEYNNYLAEQKAQREAQDEADRRVDEAIANGDYSFSETGEELHDIIWG